MGLHEDIHDRACGRGSAHDRALEFEDRCAREDRVRSLPPDWEAREEAKRIAGEKSPPLLPRVTWRSLARHVLAVAITELDGSWRAMIDAVPGQCHENEWRPVLDYGVVVADNVARELFPQLAGKPYSG